VTQAILGDTPKSLLTNTYSPAGVVKLVYTRDLKGVQCVVQVTRFSPNLFKNNKNLKDKTSVAYGYGSVFLCLSRDQTPNQMNNDYITEAPVHHLCLCSGYDGVGIGLKRVFPNMRTIAFVEREGFPIANLVAKGEANEMDASPVFTDVKTFPYDKFRGCVDILSAGFPCQPFSSSGLRQSTDDERHLYPWIANGITACQARLVLLENVEGIITAKTGDGEPVLKYVLRDLEERGYQTSWCVASANEVGAPHRRKRVFILARKLGDSSSIGSRRRSEDESGQRTEVLGSRSQSDVFPARPNERQHEWEEPRTIVTELGGATNGRPCRVNPVANRTDRLRLLGNGVVPATCERAVRLLYAELYNKTNLKGV
jgi:site-specific DNA-cytosine methylase